MDRNLPDNHRFRLNEDVTSNTDGKLHLFVKLTDSCMQKIETYMKQNTKMNLSTIKFNLHGGELTIPINSNERKTYSFQTSLENKTPEVFQCLKQINRHQLDSCGLIEQRLNIDAQEDVYGMTRIKVAEFQQKEVSMKKQTKEIGESSKTIKDKKTSKSSTSTSASNQRSSLTTMNNKSKPKHRFNQEEHLSPTPNHPSSIAERPLRERLVHLLAARTYKKPDLLARLKSEGGIRDDEKEQLDSILLSISTQSKSGELFLLKTILISGEVKYDWPFYPKAEASSVRQKIKEMQNNASRATISKTTNDGTSISNRSSLPIQDFTSKEQTSNSIPPIPKGNQSSTNRPIITDERNSLENEDIPTTSTTQNPLSDERMQQLSDMLDKLTNALSHSEKSSEELRNEMEFVDENDLDEIEKEYHRLVPEYNQLIDYLQNVSQKYSLLQEQFTEEQSSERASKIVEEFFQCENKNGFVIKRQRLIELHSKLNHFHQILQKNSFANHSHISDQDHSESDSDDDDDDLNDN